MEVFLNDGSRELVIALEADNPITRSNDGRTDPWGGFWIGTMVRTPKRVQVRSIVCTRELRKLFPSITISNAICFSPDRQFAYYTDTVTRLVMRQQLEPQDGWPTGKQSFTLIYGLKT